MASHQYYNKMKLNEIMLFRDLLYSLNVIIFLSSNGSSSWSTLNRVFEEGNQNVNKTDTVLRSLWDLESFGFHSHKTNAIVIGKGFDSLSI